MMQVCTQVKCLKVLIKNVIDNELNKPILKAHRNDAIRQQA